MMYSIFYKTRFGILVVLTCAILCSVAGQAMAMELTACQKADILAEAEAAFDRGSQTLPNNPVSARADFQTAARKYQLLADSGVCTGELYYNLGNAYLQAGRVGMAIANYKRAGQLLGPNRQLEENLRYTRSLLKGANADAEQDISSLLTGWNKRFSTETRLWLALGAWLIFWGAMITRTIVKKKFRWRYILACSAVAFLITAGSVGYEILTQTSQTQGVVTASATVVRKGNGEGFARKFKEPLNEGMEFRVLEHRGSWLHIKLADDKTGWINSADAEVIKPRPLWS